MTHFRPSVFTRTNEQGIERLRRPDGQRYAFIVPHPIGEYVSATQAPCNVIAVGRLVKALNGTFRTTIYCALKKVLFRFNIDISERIPTVFILDASRPRSVKNTFAMFTSKSKGFY